MNENTIKFNLINKDKSDCFRLVMIDNQGNQCHIDISPSNFDDVLTVDNDSVLVHDPSLAVVSAGELLESMGLIKGERGIYGLPEGELPPMDCRNISLSSL